jgi:hypothetical protein
MAFIDSYQERVLFSNSFRISLPETLDVCLGDRIRNLSSVNSLAAYFEKFLSPDFSVLVQQVVATSFP